MSNYKYIWIIDPGHAWLKVPRCEVTKDMDISRFSFYNTKHAFLEEDRDAGIFIRATGIDPQTIEAMYVDHFDRNRSRFEGKG